ncbi:hypothetical protein TBLA_0C01640 [Henningerozyma blattae CBS 6284]|uniref:Chloride channel protein n=1 Tax=Henningerozyma blattae (strain ATCC 34711 / CBS 6284 / DSM 70876 / NBRC 10599 / NRRL Y-10934 / UCD 77-7) TaxID=1071380 RepID=I2H0S6_HENB6|nr:hypothetical protein TBLA_0C01640 [Tetrapisispora blattae CBS 6284]CCH59978.1 hypothetical protein TBLA_0C01640 [Tetrapisispora blattae CBS 6284]
MEMCEHPIDSPNLSQNDITHGDGKHRFTDIPETINFDKFTTIDWMSESNNPMKKNDIWNNDRDLINSNFSHYRKLIWERFRIIVTLTLIAITIGSIAGFLQIFTETLVNWKTGHCERNWLLNKSFCCSLGETTKLSDMEVIDKPIPITKRFQSFMDYSLTKREEFECIDQGLWIKRENTPYPFLIFVALSILFATISTLLVKYFAPMATGSGISEIKVWVTGFKYNDKFLSFITLLVKSIALPLTISSGLSVGKEGPSVHYATCCAYVITNWLLGDILTYSQQAEYLTAASGAGVAVAFASPIGGVLFGLEEIASSQEFNASTLWKTYYVALAAVATLKYINPFRNGMIVLFKVTYDRLWTYQEIPVFLLLGVFGGLYGKYISKWNINYVRFRRKYLSSWPIQEVIVLSIITSLISYFNEFLKLDMTESMGVLFHECYRKSDPLNSAVATSNFNHRLCVLDENTNTWGFTKILMALLFATVMRALLVVVSYGAMIPAGIFVPSMAVGATFGRAVSLLVERFISGSGVITPGTYAFLGAAATLSGVTNLTLTVVVIMFELTGAFMYIIPTMLVVAVTRLVMNYTGVTKGISDQMIFVNGFPIMELEDENEKLAFNLNSNNLDEDTTKQIMSTNLITLDETMYLSDLKKIVFNPNNELNGFPIIRADDKLEIEKKCIGYVLKRHLITQLLFIEEDDRNLDTTLVTFTRSITMPDTYVFDFSDLVNRSPITVKPDFPTILLFRMFKQLGCKMIIVEQDGFIQGLLTKKDILRYERIKHREKFSPLYKGSTFLEEKYWPFLKLIIQKFSSKRGL